MKASFLKSLILIHYYLLASLSLFAQSSTTEKAKKQSSYDMLFPVLDNGKMGYIDMMGTVVIAADSEPISASEMQVMKDNVIIKKYNKKVYLYDRQGNLLVKEGFKSAFIDYDNEVIRVEKYSEADYDSQIVGFYNFSGKNIIPVKNKIQGYYAGYTFSDDVWVFEGEDKKVGVMNKEGKILVNPNFKSIRSFHKGLAVAQKEEGGKTGVINKEGKWVIQPNFKDILSIPYNGNGFAILGDEYVIINEKGDVEMKLENKKIGYMVGVPHIVKKNKAVFQDTQTKLYGIINPDGSIFLEPEYTFIYGEYDPSYVTVNAGGDISKGWLSLKGGRWSVINAFGQEFFKPIEVDYLSAFSEGTAYFEKDKKFGLIDDNGVVLLDAVLDYSPDLQRGYMIKYYDEPYTFNSIRSFGYMDDEGNIIWKARK